MSGGVFVVCGEGGRDGGGGLRFYGEVVKGNAVEIFFLMVNPPSKDDEYI